MFDLKELSDILITYYAHQVLDNARKHPKLRVNPDAADLLVINPAISILNLMSKYSDPRSLDLALDAIDLAKIYAGVDDREQEAQTNLEQTGIKLAYEDYVVLETLKYFKNDFFTWVNKPKCPICNEDGDNIESQGVIDPPNPNPDQISCIEVYQCRTCQRSVEFPRYNSAVKLLETRKGRCGEWVNCFMLVLSAVLGSEASIRYLWNKEDHVWCEYYSDSLKKWIHLDPCENVWDEPNLYCDNWGKKMSWVVAIGNRYIADVTDKYVTNEDKRIPKLTIANETVVLEYFKLVNLKLLVKYWIETVDTMPLSETEKYRKLYDDVLVKWGQEQAAKRTISKPVLTDTKARGRQSGKGEWTKSRGEDGA